MTEKKTLTLDEHYSIEMNSNEYYLKYEEKYIKDGKEKTKKNGWSYPKLKFALNRYLDQAQKQNSLKEILEATERVEQTIKNLCK